MIVFTFLFFNIVSEIYEYKKILDSINNLIFSNNQYINIRNMASMIKIIQIKKEISRNKNTK